MRAKFLVAKYVPDLRRMEPKNMGVVVWLDGKVQARFAGETESLEVAYPPRSLRVSDSKNYRSWIASWRRQFVKPQIELDRGQVVSRESPEFMDALQEWSRGNYLLVEGGAIVDAVVPKEIGELTEYLYRELVAEPNEKEVVEHEYERLKTAVAGVLKKSGLSTRIKYNYPAQYKHYDILRHFQFDYWLGPTAHPYSLYHRVVLSHQKTFDATVLNFEWYKQSTRFEPRRLCALIVDDAKAKQMDQQRWSENRSLLDKISRVVNVADEGSAAQQLQEVAQLNGAPSDDRV